MLPIIREPVIEIRGLTKSFGGHLVLDGIDLTIYRGDLLAIIGASGGGKSVLLRNILGLMKPDAGRVAINGRDMTGVAEKDKMAILGRLGVLFQGGALFDSLNVYDNIAFPLRERLRLSEKEIEERTAKVLKDVALPGVGHKYPCELSGGMKKRAALARAIVTKPEIVFFDEPTTGLDPLLMHSIHMLIKKNHQKYGYTGIVVSHEIPEIFSVASRVAMLHRGRIIAEGTAQEILDSPIPQVRGFVHPGPGVLKEPADNRPENRPR